MKWNLNVIILRLAKQSAQRRGDANHLKFFRAGADKFSQRIDVRKKFIHNVHSQNANGGAMLVIRIGNCAAAIDADGANLHVVRRNAKYVRVFIKLAGAAHGDTYLLIASGQDDGSLSPARLAELTRPTTDIVLGKTDVPVRVMPARAMALHTLGMSSW